MSLLSEQLIARSKTAWLSIVKDHVWHRHIRDAFKVLATVVQELEHKDFRQSDGADGRWLRRYSRAMSCLRFADTMPTS
jgi:hypothetical protein